MHNKKYKSAKTTNPGTKYARVGMDNIYHVFILVSIELSIK